MIKRITATNHLNESLDLELMFPEKSGFVILSCEGLGPIKANINMTELSTTDGALFNSARAGVRNVVLTLQFLFRPTIEDIRQKSYKYFQVKKWIKLTIETDNRTSELYGYVESNDPSIFNKEEGCTVSILCPDPNLYSTQSSNTVFSGAEPMFEFPFSNESLTENLIEISALRIDETQTVVYTGDSDIGITIYIHAIGPANGLKIYNLQTREVMELDSDKLIDLTGSDIINKDDIIISTVTGDKSITLLRDGVYYNILNCLVKGSDWFKLSQGDNLFVYTAETGVRNLQFRIENRVAYGGI